MRISVEDLESFFEKFRSPRQVHRLYRESLEIRKKSSGFAHKILRLHRDRVINVKSALIHFRCRKIMTRLGSLYACILHSYFDVVSLRPLWVVTMLDHCFAIQHATRASSNPESRLPSTLIVQSRSDLVLANSLPSSVVQGDPGSSGWDHAGVVRKSRMEEPSCS